MYNKWNNNSNSMCYFILILLKLFLVDAAPFSIEYHTKHLSRIRHIQTFITNRSQTVIIALFIYVTLPSSKNNWENFPFVF